MSAYLGLGSNVGDREAQLRAAIAALSGIGTISAISSVWETEPVGHAEQPRFLNLVLRLDTPLPAEALLTRAKEIERDLGRRPSVPNGPRSIDIDLLFHDDERRADGDLRLPHPRVLERGFTLRPLAEIDPGLRHPATGRTIADHLSAARELEAGTPLYPGERLLGDVAR